MIIIDPIKRPIPNIFGNSSVDMTEIFNKVDKKLEEFKDNIPSGNGVPIVDSEDKLDSNAPQGSLGVVAYNTENLVSVRDLYQPTMDIIDQTTGTLTTPELLTQVQKLEWTFPENVQLTEEEIVFCLVPRSFSISNQNLILVSINEGGIEIMYKGDSTTEMITIATFSNGETTIDQDAIDRLNNEILTTDDWCYFSNPEASFVITEEQFDFIDKFFKVVQGSQDTTLYINKPEGYKNILEPESVIDNITGDEKILINNNGKLSTTTVTQILDDTNTRLNNTTTKISQLENDIWYGGDGVYAVNANGNLIDYNSADNTCTGVALIAGEHKFMIAKENATNSPDTTFYWGKNLYQQDVPNLEIVSRRTAAEADYNGKTNTAAIIAGYTALGVDMHRQDMCKVLEIYNDGGYTDWYIPSLGQLVLIYRNKIKINEALTAIGGDAFSLDYYWSSSEGHPNYGWYMNFNDSTNDWISKDSLQCVRFIRDIPSIQKRISNLEQNTYTKQEIDNMIISTLNTEV